MQTKKGKQSVKPNPKSETPELDAQLMTWLDAASKDPTVRKIIDGDDNRGKLAEMRQAFVMVPRDASLIGEDDVKAMIEQLGKVVPNPDGIRLHVKLSLCDNEWLLVSREAHRRGVSMDEVINDILTSNYQGVRGVMDAFGNGNKPELAV
jgi:hypothetical protein